MKQRALRAFGLLMCCLAWTASTAGVSREADQFLARIQKEGAPAVTKALWGTADWTKLTEKIASGEPKWIDVAVALSKGSDAGATEELNDALFQGLSVHPSYVLKSLPIEQSTTNPLSLSTVCGGRTDPLSTYAAASAELTRAETAVKGVRDDALAAKKHLCLKRLEAGSSDLKRFFGASG
jgi:hypothetical protein